MSEGTRDAMESSELSEHNTEMGENTNPEDSRLTGNSPVPSLTGTFTERRSSSPGVARRVTSDADETGPVTSHSSSPQPDSVSDVVIDSLSEKLANSLLEKPSTQTPKPEYVSINQKLAEKRQQQINENMHRNQMNSSTEGPAAIHSSASLTQLSQAGDEVLLTHNGAVNGVADLGILLPGTNTNNMMDGSLLNIGKPAPTQNHTPAVTGTQTMFETSNGIDSLTPASDSSAATHEVDILTAMSGEPTPNSLPAVMDGISDGEITSDSEVDDTASIGDIPDLSYNRRMLRRNHESPDQNDTFFTTHESIMKTKTPEQLQEMRETLRDIQSVVSHHNTPAESQHHRESDHRAVNHSNPIWEIRESYAETLRQQEEKRKQRMELERRYEQEYREKQLMEIERLEADDNKILPAQSLDDDFNEPLNTDYFSSEEEDMYDVDSDSGSRGWGWGANNKYSRVGNGGEGPHRSSTGGTQSHRVNAQSSNASRLAEHDRSTSPRTVSHEHISGEKRLSNSSFSSSSQSSSVAASTLVRCKTHDRPDSDSSSSNSWDYGDTQSPAHLIPQTPDTPTTRKKREQGDYDTDEETDVLLNKPYQGEGRVDLPADTQELGNQAMKNKAKEVTVYDPDEPTVLIEGILFRAAYLGSTQLVSESQPSKAIRMLQAQEAVGRIKALGTLHFGDNYQAPDGENQPSTDVDLFVSTEKVMVLNTDLQEIMMDHPLRSISYIADIDSILVIMAKRSMMMSASSSSGEDSATSTSGNKQHKLICHIFETDEAHLIAQSIGQAFQVAYMEFLKANGIDDPNLHMKDTSYEDILEQQEIMNDELETFTRKDKQKDVIVPKTKGEALGIVIVESGWGSVLPTVILANMSPVGAAARCGQLNIGDQIMSVNGMSLVGLPLSTCQEHVKAVKNLTAVRLCVVSRPPVVEVLIKRPDKKYQLGFSVQNGVICSLLRGGIAERGGIRVGHRIIEINGQSVVATAHEKIVHMLSTSVGEIHMKTMPMAVFRLLTGQEVPVYI